jgi:hypothetical protein
MPQTISAIAGLWPLALVVVLGIGMLIFKRQIGALLERLSKLSMKRGQTEVVIESKAQEAIVVAEHAPATVEPPKQEETPKELPPAASQENSFGVMLDALTEHRFDDAQTAFEARQAAEADQTEKLREEVFYLAAFEMAVSKDTQLKLYRAAAGIFKDRGDKLMRPVALEKALELNPSDRDLRFSAAYAESEADLPHLASANYEALIEQDLKSSAVAMNNLGVQADAFKLPIKSVALYRASMKEGETLATANLAYKLLNQGFIDEARSQHNSRN